MCYLSIYIYYTYYHIFIITIDFYYYYITIDFTIIYVVIIFISYIIYQSMITNLLIHFICEFFYVLIKYFYSYILKYNIIDFRTRKEI